MTGFFEWLKARILMILYVGCGLSVVGEVVFRLVGHSYDHMHFGFEEIFGFHAGWGFVAFGLLVASAHALGAVTRRDEDYYDRGEEGDDA